MRYMRDEFPREVECAGELSSLFIFPSGVLETVSEEGRRALSIERRGICGQINFGEKLGEYVRVETTRD